MSKSENYRPQARSAGRLLNRISGAGGADRFAHHKLPPFRLASQSRSCSAQALLPFSQGVESSILSALNLGEVRPVADCSQVQIGVVYPQNEVRGDPRTVRRIGRPVEDLVCASLEGITLCPSELAIVTRPKTAGSNQ